MRESKFLAAVVWTAMSTLGVSAVSPHVALAAEDARSWAKKGADAFKKNDYLQAAEAFERAAQLDPSDPKNLRYAGRAWQQVGHLKRALVLLEMYLRIEPNPEYRASIMEFIEPLRKLTPRHFAEALSEALTKFPEGRLESEAAKAWEDVGDDAALKRAGELWEVARVRGLSDADKQTAETGVQRVTQRRQELRAKREREEEERKRREAETAARAAKGNGADPTKDTGPAVPIGTPGVTEPAPSSGLSTMRIALLAGGGALVVGGGALIGLGWKGSQDVNDKATAGGYKDDYDAYTADKSSKDTMAYVGWGVLVAGAGVAAWGALSTDAPAKASMLVPQVSPQGIGLAWSGRF